MQSIKPLTINTELIQRGINAQTDTLRGVEQVKPGLSDVVDISKTAIEKNQQAETLSSQKQIDQTALDSVQVSSTIGRSRSTNNLTNNQAAELYQEIAKLL